MVDVRDVAASPPTCPVWEPTEPDETPAQKCELVDVRDVEALAVISLPADDLGTHNPRDQQGHTGTRPGSSSDSSWEQWSCSQWWDSSQQKEWKHDVWKPQEWKEDL